MPAADTSKPVNEYNHGGVREHTEKTPYRIKITNLLSTSKAKTVFNVFQQYRWWEFPSGVDLFKEENTVTVIIRFRNWEHMKNASTSFLRDTNWGWNGGFKPRIAKITELENNEDGAYHEEISSLFLLDESTDFLGERADNALENLCPGCIARLPDYEDMPRGVQVDVRLRKDCNIDVLGHPILIVKIYDNGLVNFVICTTFRDRRPEDVFRHKPERLREFIEIDSIPGNQLRKSEMRIGKAPAIPKDLLVFTDGRRMPRRGYAGTVVYTISAKCLASLNLRGLEGLPGGCMKVHNSDLFIERIMKIGDDPDAEYLTSEFLIPTHLIFPSREDGRGVWAPGPWSDPESKKD